MRLGPGPSRTAPQPAQEGNVAGSGPEHAVAEGVTDGLLVHQPGPRADLIVRPRRVRTYLPCDVADHDLRRLGRVGRERSEEPHRAQLHV